MYLITTGNINICFILLTIITQSFSRDHCNMFIFNLLLSLLIFILNYDFKNYDRHFLLR
jgi:hypothetical protein